MDPASEMGPLVTREHRDKVAGYLDSGAGAGRDGRRRRPRRRTRGRRLLPRRLAARRRDARRWTPTATRSSGRCCRCVRVRHLRRGLEADQRQPVRQRHRDLHPRRRRGPSVPVRRQRRHGRDQRADSGAGRLLLASAAGRRRCSATATSTGPRASTSTRAARSSRAAGPTRPPARSISGSRRRGRPDPDHHSRAGSPASLR